MFVSMLGMLCDPTCPLPRRAMTSARPQPSAQPARASETPGHWSPGGCRLWPCLAQEAVRCVSSKRLDKGGKAGTKGDVSDGE